LFSGWFGGDAASQRGSSVASRQQIAPLASAISASLELELFEGFS
jgi:hypothetical protein